MLFTWDTTNLCIIFHWWHVRSFPTLLLSLLAVAALTAGYEYVREASRRYESGSAEYVNSLPSTSSPRARARSSPLSLCVSLLYVMGCMKLGERLRLAKTMMNLVVMGKEAHYFG